MIMKVGNYVKVNNPHWEEAGFDPTYCKINSISESANLDLLVQTSDEQIVLVKHVPAVACSLIE